ncbi:hypothetical protein BU23DRAFT_552920 [Bimuria novae-zelandiae CBS 107.79]|uniref:Uncharacterized protein n=1 Tax=Bimuria novae-zelandiae CBS 107.79 TaxID=1447943 RepID=A0A6A5VD58_9PLEO|nr:hypothetical protein BU23DRAFT_552920 [Bimuria novae-zelandiae CBS 107.79]
MDVPAEQNSLTAQGDISQDLSPRESYRRHKDLLRDIIANDHFGDQPVPEIIEQWVAAMEPGVTIPLPANIKGFYGGSLRASIPIEVARGSYKHIVYETVDKAKVEKYAQRMLIALSTLDVRGLMNAEPVLGAAALWHKALAEVRLPDCSEALGSTLRLYEAVRPKVNLSDSKMPQPARLKTRLVLLAQELDNRDAFATLEAWLPSE